jgi:uncharacterized protein (DUF433 family)
MAFWDGYTNRMRTSKRRSTQRVELGRYIVADPAICHGKPTFKGTRVFVADVLADSSASIGPGVD